MASTRNIISALTVVGIVGIYACSEKPDYQGITNRGAANGGQDALGNKTADAKGPGHEAMPEDAKQETKAPSVPPAPPAPPAPGALTTPNADSYKAMIANQQMYNVVRVTQLKDWGTTAAAPLEVKVAVDAAGAPAAAPIRTQLFLKNPAAVSAIDYKTPPKLEFVNGQGADTPVNGMVSMFVVCNDQATNIYLHSGTGGAPFAHGNAAIRQGQCAAFPAQNANAYQAGAAYDHIIGDGNSDIFLKVTKIGPDGNVVP